MSDHENFGPCCCCEQDEDVRTIIMLEKLSPIPGHGWGCFVTKQPQPWPGIGDSFSSMMIVRTSSSCSQQQHGPKFSWSDMLASFRKETPSGSSRLHRRQRTSLQREQTRRRIA